MGFSVCFEETAISHAIIFFSTIFFSLLVQSVTHIGNDPVNSNVYELIFRMCQDHTANINK